MAMAQGLLPEFDHEMALTRMVLERIPEEKTAFRPHPRSWTLGELGLHLANIPVWAVHTLSGAEFDVAPAGGTPPRSPTFESAAASLRLFDENVAWARALIAASTDLDLAGTWSLKRAGTSIFTLPRAAVLRSMVLSHMIHHRGQATVYLRMCDVPLPPIYG